MLDATFVGSFTVTDNVLVQPTSSIAAYNNFLAMYSKSTLRMLYAKGLQAFNVCWRTSFAVSQTSIAVLADQVKYACSSQMAVASRPNWLLSSDPVG